MRSVRYGLLLVALMGMGCAGQAWAAQPVEDFEAGPIWNNAVDAKAKCPHVCENAEGIWNGQWRTTVWNKMSVCGCVISAGPHWNYEENDAHGPAHWGDYSATCESGYTQSPINIETNKVAVPTLHQPIPFNYSTYGKEILNNGHTVQVNMNPGSSIELGGTVYPLVQFHFHTLSENQIDGKASDLEMHLVHKTTDGQLAVVAVMFNKGAENPELAKLWTQLSRNKGTQPLNNRVNPAALLPKSHDYYSYDGSLTTPPCTEGVSWLVMKEPLTASEEQIQAFAGVMPKNARPVQELHSRTIQLTTQLPQ